jgi:Zn-dependent protease
MLLGLTFPILIARLIILFTSLSVHEFSHAWTADHFGDPTPRMDGRLTLNPLAHLDPIGSLMLILAGFGWAKPVQVNPYALQRHSRSALMWVSFAGPLSNLLIAILAAIPYRLGLVSATNSLAPSNSLLPTLNQLLGEFIWINLTLMLFNLIPLAPLDGEKIADYIFPPPWVRFLDRIRPYSMLILIGLIFVPQLLGFDLLGAVMGPPLNLLYRLLVG